jgi:hypothetical protein
MSATPALQALTARLESLGIRVLDARETDGGAFAELRVEISPLGVGTFRMRLDNDGHPAL